VAAVAAIRLKHQVAPERRMAVRLRVTERGKQNDDVAAGGGDSTRLKHQVASDRYGGREAEEGKIKAMREVCGGLRTRVNVQ
jgi:hypothetical protein